MGPSSLSSRLPEAASAYWAQLPADLDRDAARAFLAQLAQRVAGTLGVPKPDVLGDGHDARAITHIVDSVPAEFLVPDLLGATWEQLMTSSVRRARGAHFTPIAVADRVVGHAFDQAKIIATGQSDELRVWDPAAGGGAFLLAAARWLEQSTSMTRPDIVASLYASDVDSVALDVCAASLELWSGGVATPVVACADALLDLPSEWPEDFSAVVGNPPFLGQLSTDTARDETRRSKLALAYPDVSHGYVDECALFLHLSLARTKPGGVVSLILPESVLAARDASAVRILADDRAMMKTLWVDDGQSFDASVDVVAPVLVVRREPVLAHTSSSAQSEQARVVLGDDLDGVEVGKQTDGHWAPLLAAARGVPAVEPSGASGAVADIALVTAGFRQHFYGIADAVEESSGSSSDRPLVTAGAIDPLCLRWGLGTVKFAGVRWAKPVVNVANIPDPAVRSWFEARSVPKLLVASQTRVIEVVVDESGALLPSVPVLSVEPQNPEDLWRLAAALSSPVMSAWMATRAAGTGLATTAFRIRASELATAPLPTDVAAWSVGAQVAREAQHAVEMGDASTYATSMKTFAEVMNSAYRAEDGRLIDWWWDRLRLPEVC